MHQGDKSAGSGSRAKPVFTESFSVPDELALEIQPETSGAAAAETAVGKACWQALRSLSQNASGYSRFGGGGETDQASIQNITQRR